MAHHVTRPYTVSVLVPLPIGIELEHVPSRKARDSLRRKLWRTAQSLMVQGIDRWEMVVGVTAQSRSLVSEWLKEWLPDSRLRKRHFRVETCLVDEHSQSLKLGKLIRASRSDWTGFAFAGDRFAPHFVYECLMRIAQRPHVEMVYFDDDLLKVTVAGNMKSTLSIESESNVPERYTRIKPQFKPDFSPDFLFNYNYIGLSFLAKREKLLNAVSFGFKQSLNFPWQLVLAISGSIVAEHKQQHTGKPLPAWHEQFPIQHIGHVLRHRDVSKLMGIGSARLVGDSQLTWHETCKDAILAGRELVATSLPEAKVQLLSSRHRRSSPSVTNEAVTQKSAKTLSNGSIAQPKQSPRVVQALNVTWSVSRIKQIMSPPVSAGNSVASPTHQSSEAIATASVAIGLPPKVSIIVPTKDHCSMLKLCVESILDKTNYPNYELVVVDNQTTQVAALRYLASLERSTENGTAQRCHQKRANGKGVNHEHVPVEVMRYAKPFNYSDINNQAVAASDGEVLVFMNNDVEVLGGDWLTELVSHAIRPDVGCVGAKLLYPDYTIQHAGVSLGMHGVADHMYRGLSESVDTDPYGYLQCVRNTGAVTGAVMAVRRSVFEAIGGFDAKKLPVAFNDVDLCLKAEMAGYRTVWTPHACLIHHESKTRAPRKTALAQKPKPTKCTKEIRGAAGLCGTHSGTPVVDAKVQSHATERSEIAHMRKSWGRLLRGKFQVLAHRHEPLRFL